MTNPASLMKTGSDDSSKVYLVGSGIASLASAFYLIRDAGLRGANVAILEQDSRAGGALDGQGDSDEGFVIRGGRMHERKFVCYWDLLSGMPSATAPGRSVTEETFELAAGRQASHPRNERRHFLSVPA